MTYPKRVLIALDQLFATVFLGSMPDETLSAAAYRRQWRRTQALINWLFRDPDHCRDSYYAELTGLQNHPDYRKE